MRNRKRFWPLRNLIGSLVLVAGLLMGAPSVAYAEYAGFSDVGRRDWCVTEGYLDYVLESGLMTGKDDRSFAPGEAVSRAQAVTVLWRISGEPEAGSTDFSDCEQGAFYAPRLPGRPPRES